MLQLPTSIEKISFKDVTLYLKRDDQIHPDFSGNKARKFHYFLDNDFPDVAKLVSYGSSQSNAMYSMSVLAKMRGWKFEFTVDHLSEYLRENPHGNYKAALENGMLLRLGSATILRQAQQPYINEANKRSLPEPAEGKTTLYIEEGGRQAQAQYGIEILAQEIMAWQAEQGIEALNIFLPSGTGTTALYLQKALIQKGVVGAQHPTVFTCACVGGSAYLKKQFLMLEREEVLHPTILSLEKKHHFGKLYKENYKIWLELRQQTGVVFDLLYDALGWRVMLAHQALFDKPVLYIHQGGVLGNESMLPRYQRKYPSIENE